MVHRNKLMCVNELPKNVFGEVEPAGNKAREPQKQSKKKEKSHATEERNSDDSDDIVQVYVPQMSTVPQMGNLIKVAISES